MVQYTQSRPGAKSARRGLPAIRKSCFWRKKSAFREMGEQMAEAIFRKPWIHATIVGL